MDVGVDKPREHVLTGGVDDLDAVIGGSVAAPGGAHLGDPAVADEDIMGLVEVAARVQDVRTADQEVGARLVGVEESLGRHGHATAAARTGEPTSSS
jgi:hypothetical protein